MVAWRRSGTTGPGPRASVGGAIACFGHPRFASVEIGARWRAGRVTPVDGAPSPVGALGQPPTRAVGDMLVRHAA